MFDWLDETSPESAEVVVPMVIDLVGPESVVDIGCGRGAWLSAFRRCGVYDVVGLDGDYVDRDGLAIPSDCFQAADLSQPIRLGRSFDLAVCLEVAEHLPASASANLVGALTTAAPVVLFSAAIPGQGGVGHVNEQWPDYWRSLFEQKGYVALDILRPQLWDDPRVAFRYRQNSFLYASVEHVGEHPDLAEGNQRQVIPSRIVHPDLFQRMVRKSDPLNHSIATLLRALPRAAAGAVRRRVNLGKFRTVEPEPCPR